MFLKSIYLYRNFYYNKNLLIFSSLPFRSKFSTLQNLKVKNLFTSFPKLKNVDNAKFYIIENNCFRFCSTSNKKITGKASLRRLIRLAKPERPRLIGFL